MRPVLPPEKLTPKALEKIQAFEGSVVTEVQDAIRANRVVVVGMAQNPFVKKARNLLTEKGIEFKYLEYGSYFSSWKPRLAIKLWSGWPTFPQVFMEGRLVGGYQDLLEHLQKN